MREKITVPNKLSDQNQTRYLPRGAGELGQWLQAPTALAEERGSIPSTHRAAYPPLTAILASVGSHTRVTLGVTGTTTHACKHRDA